MELDTKDIITMFERSDIDILNQYGGLDGFAEAFTTDLRNGISKGEAANGFQDRILTYGCNKLPDPPVKSWCRMFMETFKDLTLKILLFAAVLSAVLAVAFHYDDLSFTEFIDTISIIIAVLIVSCVTAQTNYAQQQAYLEINNLKNTYPVTVIRAGEKQQVMSTEVLVGDVLELKAGDCVAADALMITGTNLTINNSAQTGEPIAVKVTQTNPFLRGGGAIESGIGTCLVAAVGPNSQYGVTMTQIAEIEAKEEKTPLEKKLDNLAMKLTYIAIGGAALTFVVLMIMWFIDLHNDLKDGGKVPNERYQDLLDKIMVVITIFLCCVPEGLPLAVTLALSFSMKKMMNDNNFVRHLNACETMGGATTICSDKTGTLTQNKMTVVKYWQDGKEQNGHPELSEETLTLISNAIAINSTATHTIKEGTEETVFVGSSSECALLKMLSDYGKDYQEIRELNPIVKLNEFNSARKRMSTLIKTQEGHRLYYKGAPDFSLPLVKYYVKENGEVAEATEEVKNQFLQKVTDFASQAYRTLLLAYRDFPGDYKYEYEDPAFVEKDLTAICIVGIQDPLRDEVPAAIKACHEAGVVVRMVTGDFIATARAISAQCGILSKETDIVMEGSEFAKLSKVELLDKIDDLRVLARSSPTDKYRLVSFLMECGEVVAVTGDGSNDSAALKKANVGLSMGMCGTELAKIASDIVILDDNFKSIVSALKWGRCVYDNLRSFLQFQVPVNLVAVVVCIIGTVYLKTSPLKPIQILWINLINDSLGALALATRSPTDALLRRKPYGEGGGLVSNVIARNIAVHTVYQIIVELLILFGYHAIFGVSDSTEDKDYVSSWMFNTFVFMNVFNLINSRVAGHEGSVFDHILSNPYFVAIFLLIAVLQIVIILVGGRAFYAKKPSGKEWGITMAFSVAELIVGFLARLVKLEDRTLDDLNAYRAMRKDKVRAYYSTMSTEAQWDEKNLLTDEVEVKAPVNIETDLNDDGNEKPAESL